MEVDICVGVVSRWSQMGASHDGGEYMSTLNTRTLKTRGRMICLFCRQGGGFKKFVGKKIFGRRSFCIHTSIVFKKKWKPALRETLDSKGRTHVRTTRTESTCDCGEYRSEYGIENENGGKKRDDLTTSRSPL